MAQIREIDTKDLKRLAPTLKIGDKILLSGYIFTARDAVHKRFFALLDEGKDLPVEIEDAVVYYAGPTQAPKGKPIGSCGPTTSSRMDKFAPRLLDLGLGAMIGKGERNKDVVDAIVRNKAVYLCAIGGCGALACNCIKSCDVVAFNELGCESVKSLYIEKFPLVVAVDSFGGDIFKQGRQAYSNS